MNLQNSIKDLKFSIIIPVYNRPQEIEELLVSLTKQSYKKDFEVVVVEDGSTLSSKEIVEKYSNRLNVAYYFKENSGAGLSRNFGMQKATGNYFIIFDSDCIIPVNYLNEVDKKLKQKYTDAFGGADAAHKSFTAIQKAINYSMTSFFTTGGLRGSKNTIHKFQPRSFNFGISKNAFEITKGFSAMKIGEDIDLTFRLWQHNFETQFIENAFVYHKRRVSFSQFFKQVFAFGKGRPFLNKKYPETSKLSFWLPTLFIIGLFIAIVSLLNGFIVPIIIYAFYFIILFFDSLLKNKNIGVAWFSVVSTCIQFTGYGLGFLVGVLSKTK